MNKHKINIFIALVLVLIVIAAVSALLTSRNINNTADPGADAERHLDPYPRAGAERRALGKPEHDERSKRDG